MRLASLCDYVAWLWSRYAWSLKAILDDKEDVYYY